MQIKNISIICNRDIEIRANRDDDILPCYYFSIIIGKKASVKNTLSEMNSFSSKAYSEICIIGLLLLIMAKYE